MNKMESEENGISKNANKNRCLIRSGFLDNVMRARIIDVGCLRSLVHRVPLMQILPYDALEKGREK